VGKIGGNRQQRVKRSQEAYGGSGQGKTWVSKFLKGEKRGLDGLCFFRGKGEGGSEVEKVERGDGPYEVLVVSHGSSLKDAKTPDPRLYGKRRKLNCVMTAR